MHRFLDFKIIGRGADCDLVVDDPRVATVHARLALRANGTLWLLENDRGCEFQVDRGQGWTTATRLCLCAGDRIRLGKSEVALRDISGLFGVDPHRDAGAATESTVPGIITPAPLSAPRELVEKPRRNPGTGQIERTE